MSKQSFRASIVLSLLAVSGPAFAGDAGSVITSWVRSALEAKEKPVKEIAATPSSDPVVAKINEIIAAQKNLIADIPHQNYRIVGYNNALDNLRQIEDYLKTSNPDEALDRKQKLAAVKAIQLLPPINRNEFKHELERLQYFGGDIAAKAASLLLNLDEDPVLFRPSGMTPGRLAKKKPLLTQIPYDANIAEMDSLLASRKSCPTVKKWKGWMDDLDKREAAVQKQISDLQATDKERSKRIDTAEKELAKAKEALASAEYNLHPNDGSYDYDYDRPSLYNEERTFYDLNGNAYNWLKDIFVSREEQQKDVEFYYSDLSKALQTAAESWVGNGSSNFDGPSMLLGKTKVGTAPAASPFWKPGKDSSEKPLDIKSLADLNTPRFQKLFVEKIGSSTDPDFRYHLTEEGKREIYKLFPSLYAFGQYSHRDDYYHHDITSVALNELGKLDELRKTAQDDERDRETLAAKYKDVTVGALNRFKEANQRVEEATKKQEEAYGYGGYELDKRISALKDNQLKAVQTARQKVEDLRNICREADANVFALDGREPSSHQVENIKNNYDQVAHTTDSSGFDEMIHPKPPPKPTWPY